MKIITAKTAGFCMGVRRAVEMVLDASNRHETPIYTFGPLIHNPQVLSLLEEKGIFTINDIPEAGSGTVLIRAHGVPPEIKEKLINAGFKVIDATCPRVIKVQTIINKHTEQGYASIIVGDKDHPEVVGLLGYSGKKGYVVNTLQDLDALPVFDKAIVVAQTTQNTYFFEDVKKKVAAQFPHYKIFNTICDSTEKRQSEVHRIAKSVDAVIVVGGINSGNTQRLVEIARQTGKPAFHIEKETDLAAASLSSVKNIGITAGASTPNWIIKKVYRELESFPYRKGLNWRKLFFALQRALLLTNIYVAIGAGCLAYACITLQGLSDSFSHILIAVLYVLSMHILNHLTATKSDRYNDPERAAFYENNMVLLAALAIIAGGAGLVTAFTMGFVPFMILFVMSIMGLSYNLWIVPKSFSWIRYRRIRDLPGSKTVLIAMAWGVVTSVCPALSEKGAIDFSTGVVFLWSSGMVFIRTAFFDILDMQGDRIVGKETFPILLGEKLSKRILIGLLIFLFFMLILSSAYGVIPPLGYALIINPVLMFIVLRAYEKDYVHPGFKLVFMVESHFILAGVITFIWSMGYWG